MKNRLAVVALLATAASQASAAAVYEQFNYTAGDLGTVSSPVWTPSSTGTGDVKVQVGSPNASLQFTDANPSYTTLGTPAGNLAALSNLNGKIDRISTSPLGTGSGTLYYSLLLKVSDLTNATTGGGFVAGFNNSVSTATTNITQAGARLQIRKSLTDGTKYNLGIRSDVSANGTSTLTWDTVDRTVGDTLFIVGEYEFNLNTTSDDVSRLWINPTPASLAAVSPPATTLTSTGGDINQLQIQSFFLRQVSGAALPRTVLIDELRLDSSWAGVTDVPEPGMLSLLGVGAAGLLRRRRA